MSSRAAKPDAGTDVVPLANVDGERMPLAEAKVPVLDRGFLFGDSVYEVLRVYAGKPWLEDEHFARLGHSLAEIRIAGVDLERVRRRMRETIAAGPFKEATAYIQITRGAAPRSHPFPSGAVPFELIFVQPFRDPYVEARQNGGGVVTREDIRWARCDIKSTNLLANVLAMQSAKEAACVEAILYRPDGTVTEGTHSSLFGVVAGTLRTAPRTNAILPGVTRGLLTRLAKEAAVTIDERGLSRDELARVDELFLTGTTTEVLPVVTVDGRPVGDGRPGPVTRRLQETYNRAVSAFLAKAV
jgi:D-alanine transaminase